MTTDDKSAGQGPQEWSFTTEADVTEFGDADCREMVAGRLDLPEDHDIVAIVSDELYRAALEVTVKVKAVPTGDRHAIGAADRWEVKVTWDK